MITMDDVRSSNEGICSRLPSKLVAVFVGGTNGIGEATLKQFAQHVPEPHIVLVGRSQEAAGQIVEESKKVNEDAQFTFIQADTSLIENVDIVSNEIKKQFPHINLLFLSIGTSIFEEKTKEGLHYIAALDYYARVRFMQNLLPQVQTAKFLRRVVNVLAGTKEGPINVDNFQGWGLGRGQLLLQLASMMTLELQTMAEEAKTVSFIHSYPGSVKTGIWRSNPGGAPKIEGPYIDNAISGGFHLFLSTSPVFPPSSFTGVEEQNFYQTVTEEDSVKDVADGVYMINEKGEPSELRVENILKRMKDEGVQERLAQHTKEVFQQIITDGVYM